MSFVPFNVLIFFHFTDSGFVERKPQVLLPGRDIEKTGDVLVPAEESPTTDDLALEVVDGSGGKEATLGVEHDDSTIAKYHAVKKLSTFMEIGDVDIAVRPREDSVQGSEHHGRPRRATFMETGDVEAEVVDSSNWAKRTKAPESETNVSASAGRSRTASYTPPMGRLAVFASRKSIKKPIDVAEIPWVAMLTNRVSITLLFVSFAQGWISFIIGTQMPSFLHDHLGKCHFPPHFRFYRSHLLFDILIFVQVIVLQQLAF